MKKVLDGVVRLSSVYIKLVRTGCILFKDFAIQLYCDTSPGRTVVADLEFKNKGPSLKVAIFSALLPYSYWLFKCFLVADFQM